MLIEYIFILIIVLWIYQRWKKRDIYEMGRRLHSGVRAIPLLGHAYLFFGSNENRMKAIQILGRDALRNENGLTSLWHYLYGYTLYTVVCDPVAAEFIMKTTLEKDHTMTMFKPYLGNGSIFAPVSIWKPRRKILLPIFAPRNIKKFLVVFNKQSNVLAQQLDKVAGAGTISIWQFLTAYTMDSIAEATLGFEIHAQNNSGHPLLEIFDTVLRIATDRVCSPWLYNDAVFYNLPVCKRMLKLRDYVRGYIQEIITSKRKEISEDKSKCKDDSNSEEKLSTFLELLIQSSGGEYGYSDTVIIEELAVLLLAGNDSSAVAFSFVSLMLSRHADVQEKVFEELKSVFGESDRPATMDDLISLKYLDAVIRESLRLYTPVPIITRQIDKEFVLPSGFKMVAGTGVIINIWAIHRNPRYWGDDAEQFRPERFIDTPLKHQAAFMPFSLGPRNCIGYQVALTSLKVGVLTVLRRFKILPAHDVPSSMQPPIRLEFDLMMKDVDMYQIRLERRI